MYFVIKESFARTNFQNAVEKNTDLGINHSVTESHDNDDDDSAHNSKSIFSDIMKKATMGRRQVIVEDIKMDDLYSLLKASERWINTGDNVIQSDMIFLCYSMERCGVVQYTIRQDSIG